MKLLDKKKIASDANIQKKAQIDEGVVIAKKVDVLREELPRLEKQRSDFFEGSKTELKKAIGALEVRKEELEGEIRKAEIVLAEKRKPLDDEWARLAEDVLALHNGQEQLKVDKYELSQKTERIKETEERLSKEAKGIEETKRTTGRLNSEAKALHTEAQRINFTITQNAEAHRRAVDEENKELAKRRTQIDIDAKANARDKELLAIREKALDERERGIKDKYAQLVRTAKRLKDKL